MMILHTNKSLITPMFRFLLPLAELSSQQVVHVLEHVASDWSYMLIERG